MRHIPFRLLPLMCLGLAACGSGMHSADYVGGAASVECAPFARALTGISVSGEAAEWWRLASGRYKRMQRPEVGSILVFRRSRPLPHGHVAVVSQVLSQRRILVTQANWVHHRITVDQPVIDTSPDGDWSTVRVWWPPNQQMGTADYPTFGFIRPEQPSATTVLSQPPRRQFGWRNKASDARSNGQDSVRKSSRSRSGSDPASRASIDS